MKNSVKCFIKNEALWEYLFVLRDNKSDIVEPNMRWLVGWGIDDESDLAEVMHKKIKEELWIEVFDLKPLHDLYITHILDGKEHEVVGHYFIAKTKMIVSGITLTKWQRADFFTLDEIKSMDNVAIAVK